MLTHVLCYNIIMLEKLEINNTCISCDNCRIFCPEHSVFTNGKSYTIDPWSCTRCGICIELCPPEAIKIIHIEKIKIDQL